MIISFSVQNFRSIRDKVTLDFRATTDKHQEEYFVVDIPKPKLRILKMAMIYGANASGKTSILMALNFLRDLVLSPVNDKNSLLDIPAFVLDIDKPSIFEIEFYYREVCYDYKLEIDRHRIISETLDHYPKGAKALVFERTLQENKETYHYKWSSQWFKKNLKERLILTIKNQTILSAIALIEDNGPVQIAHDWFRLNLQPLLLPHMGLVSYMAKKLLSDQKEKSALIKFILPLLQKADLWIDDIQIDESEVEIDHVPKQIQEALKINSNSKDLQVVTKIKLGLTHRTPDGDFVLDYDHESSGTKRFYGFCGLLMDLIKNNVSIPIDEIESSLHDELLFHFIRIFLYNSKRGQLFFSSHNTALLNERDIIRRDAIWITDRKSDGSTELTPLTDYPVRKEHAIDKLFKKGLIGGKPHLGSIYAEVQYEEEKK